MDTHEESPYSESSSLAVFSAALFSLFSVVLAASPWLSGHGETVMLVRAFYVWMLVLLTLSIIAMIGFICLKNNQHYLEQVPLNREWDKVSKTVFCVTLSLFCFATVSHQGNLLFNVSKGDTVFPNESGYAVIFVTGCYTMLQLAFLVFVSELRCKDGTSRLLLSFVTSGNACLCVYFTLNIFYASTKFDCDNNTDSEKPKLDNTTGPGFRVHVLNNTSLERERSFFHFVYPCPIEFCILSFYMILRIWRNADTREQNDIIEPTGREQSTRASSQETIHRCFILRRAVFNSGRFLLKNALYIAIFVGVSDLTFRTYMFFKRFPENINCKHGKTNSTNLSVNCPDSVTGNEEHSIYYEQTIFAYVEALLVFAGYSMVRRIKIRDFIYSLEDYLLLFCALGTLISVIFLTIDTASMLTKSDEVYVILYFIKLLLLYEWIYCQAAMVIKCSKMECVQALVYTHPNIAYALVAVICVSNLEKMLKDNFVSKSSLIFAFDSLYLTTFGQKNWFLLTKLFNAFNCLFRLISALKCYRILRDLKKDSNTLERVPSLTEEHSS